MCLNGTSHVHCLSLLVNIPRLLRKFLRKEDVYSDHMILVNNQIDAQFFMYVYFYSLHGHMAARNM